MLQSDIQHHVVRRGMNFSRIYDLKDDGLIQSKKIHETFSLTRRYDVD